MGLAASSMHRAAGMTEVGDASVYGTLRRLYAGGSLTSYVVPSDEGPHRKYYGLTAQGRTDLAHQAKPRHLYTSPSPRDHSTHRMPSSA